MIPIKQSEVDTIRSLRAKGKTLQSIVDQTGLSVSTVRRYTSDIEIKTKYKHSKLSEKDKKEILKQYKAGVTQMELSKKYGVTPNTIRYHISEEYRNEQNERRKNKGRSSFQAEKQSIIEQLEHTIKEYNDELPYSLEKLLQKTIELLRRL